MNEACSARPQPIAALSPWVGAVLLAALYLIPLLGTLRAVGDTDTWWHLRAGQWIVTHQAIPGTDPFAADGAERPWFAYSWLYEVVLYTAYAALGLAGVVLCRTVLVLLAIVSLHQLIARREPRFLVATGLAGVCAMALVPLMNERPWLLSITFSCWTLHVILQLRAGAESRAVWLLSIAYLLWANTHIQFVHGLFLLGLACIATMADRMRGLPCVGGRKLVALTALCGTLTLANPYHVWIYQAAWDCATMKAGAELIRELTAMTFRQPWEWAVLMLALATTFRLGRRRTLPSFDVLLLMAAAYFCFHARRDAWLMILAAAALLPDPHAQSRRCLLTLRHGLTAAGLLLVLGTLIWQGRGLSHAALEQAEAAVYPRRATDWLERQGFTGRLFNDFNWGGYLLWRLPQMQVSIDGRAHIYRDEEMQRSNDTWQALPGWHEDPALGRADVILANNATALAAALHVHPDFELVYQDELACVFRPRPLLVGTTLQQRAGAATIRVVTRVAGGGHAEEAHHHH